MFVIGAIISIIGPMLGIASPASNLAFTILGQILGYFAYKTKPAAGVLAGLIVPFAMQLACNYYFQERSGFYRIELAIPLFLAFIPAAIIFLLVSKLVYGKPKQENSIQRL